METLAVVFDQPQSLSLTRLELPAVAEEDVVVKVEWSAISTGTERLLWTGRMPPFPGMGYPLVPGYESVGRVIAAGRFANLRFGTRVFVPGAQCYGDVRGLFGGAASRIVVPASRVTPIEEEIAEEGVLLALAATAHHAMMAARRPPELVIGHGALGRLMARLVIANGGPAPTVWECCPDRASGSDGYPVIDQANDTRRDYKVICDASGDGRVLDAAIDRLEPGGTVILAGFYQTPISFDFPPAFMREATLQVAAQWQPDDLAAVVSMVETGRLSLSKLITHRRPAASAAEAYRTAFDDPNCLKMVLDWRESS